MTVTTMMGHLQEWPEKGLQQIRDAELLAAVITRRLQSTAQGHLFGPTLGRDEAPEDIFERAAESDERARGFRQLLIEAIPFCIRAAEPLDDASRTEVLRGVFVLIQSLQIENVAGELFDWLERHRQDPEVVPARHIDAYYFALGAFAVAQPHKESPRSESGRSAAPVDSGPTPEKAEEFWLRLWRNPSTPVKLKPRSFIGLRLQSPVAAAGELPALVQWGGRQRPGPGPLLHGMWLQPDARKLLLDKLVTGLAASETADWALTAKKALSGRIGEDFDIALLDHQIAYAIEHEPMVVVLGRLAAVGSASFPTPHELGSGMLEEFFRPARFFPRANTLKPVYQALSQPREGSALASKAKEFFNAMQPSDGYSILARIVARAFESQKIHLALVSGYDSLLEDALIPTRVRYTVYHLPRESELEDLSRDFDDKRKLKIVKLFGDCRSDTAIFTRETNSQDTYVSEVLDRVSKLLGRPGRTSDVLALGVEEDDPVMQLSTPSTHSSLWWVSRGLGEQATELLRRSREGGYRLIGNEAGDFGDFCNRLSKLNFIKDVEEVEGKRIRYELAKNVDPTLTVRLERHIRRAIRFLKAEGVGLSGSEVLASMGIEKLADHLAVGVDYFTSEVIPNCARVDPFHWLYTDEEETLVKLVERYPTFEEKSFLGRRAKIAIARRCAEKIKSGNVLFLDGGTTTLAVFYEISLRVASGKLKGITIITNSSEIAREVPRALRSSDLQVFHVGGLVRSTSQATHGDFAAERASELLRHVNKEVADQCFIGATFIAFNGYCCATPKEIGVKQSFLVQSLERYIVADHTKFRFEVLPFAFETKVDEVTLMVDDFDHERVDKFVGETAPTLWRLDRGELDARGSRHA